MPRHVEGPDVKAIAECPCQRFVRAPAEAGGVTDQDGLAVTPEIVERKA
jgi:hypothetical protein